MFFHTAETGGRSDGCTGPDESEKSDAPAILIEKDGEREGGIAAGNVPIDGGVVPLSQAGTPWIVMAQTVVKGRRHV